MKAAIFKGEKTLVVEDIPDPKPEDDEIIVKVHYCAICGSDLHRYAYGMTNPGTIMGHEYSGEIVDFGKKVEGFKVGDRVIRCSGKVTLGRELPNYLPRYSARTRGFLPQKPGAYAQYLALKQENVMRIPAEVTDLEASLSEPLTIAVHALRISKMKLGDNAVILGAGPIGLFAQQCANLCGASKIYVSEINSARAAAALKLGAHQVFDPIRVDLVKQIIRLTEIGADVVFESAGAKPTLQQALELVKMHGRVIVISLCWEQADCLPVEWVGREVEMRASYGYFNSEWLISMSLLQQKKIKTDLMISKIVGLSEIQRVFLELLKPGNNLIQVVVQCNE